MFTADQYQLLDFGEGRKLERFGPFVLDRPAPVCAGVRRAVPVRWPSAAARFERGSGDSGAWLPERALPDRWTIAHESLRFELRPTAFGHLGVFPEQAENWEWLANQVRRAGRPLRILNLFAYTGGCSLAAAAAGAQVVVHVDAAKSVVGWARQNAARSGLAAAPIRWLVDDARTFAGREVRRGNRYDAVILDPPSYGHGPRGEPWKISQDLLHLLRLCGELTRGRCAFGLLTCHSPDWGPAELERAVAETVLAPSPGSETRILELVSATGRRLPSGVAVRWPA